MVDVRDFAYKTFWTAVAAAFGALGGGPILFDVPALKSAGIAALTVVINAVTIFARQRAGQGGP